MQVFLETERLVLRRFTEADVDNLCDLDSDPAVMRFLTGGTPTPRDAIRALKPAACARFSKVSARPASLRTFSRTRSPGWMEA